MAIWRKFDGISETFLRRLRQVIAETLRPDFIDWERHAVSEIIFSISDAITPRAA
ncbi:hypothetical protein WBP06_24665 [Novosphingobium sp. BL-8H]|uniref:hypothetical protein n=1 Tax=Novosphingobium sp. BL-8H TaxID=3127640 RepID=UPI0037570C42